MSVDVDEKLADHCTIVPKAYFPGKYCNYQQISGSPYLVNRLHSTLGASFQRLRAPAKKLEALALIEQQRKYVILDIEQDENPNPPY